MPSCTLSGLCSGYIQEGAKSVNPCNDMGKLGLNLVPNQDPDIVVDLLRKHLDNNGFRDIKIKVLGKNKTIRTPVNTSFADIIRKFAAMVYDRSLIIELTGLGGSPGAAFRDVWPEMQIIGIGPDSARSLHYGFDKKIAIEDYKEAMRHVMSKDSGLY